MERSRGSVNVMAAFLPKGKMWYLKPDEHDFLMSEEQASAAELQMAKLCKAGA